ncbi:MAG: ATP-binding protein [Candidatus Thorarchaeota archaeon]
MVLGLISWIVKNGAKLMAIAVPSILPMGFLVAFYRSNPFMPNMLNACGTLLWAVCIGAGMAAGIVKGNWRVMRYSGPLALLSIPVVFGIGLFIAAGAIAVAVLSIEVVIVLTAVVVVIGFLVFIELPSKNESDESTEVEQSITSRFLQWTGQESNMFIGAIEIVEFPEAHLYDNSRTRERMDRYTPFLGVVRAMRSAAHAVGLRVERVQRKNRMFYLTRARTLESLNESLDKLESTLKTQLREFKCRRIGKFSPSVDVANKKCLSAMVVGVPLSITDARQSVDGLTYAVDALHELENGIIQIWADPYQSGMFETWMARREFEEEERKSKRTNTSSYGGILSGSGQESYIEVDTSASTKAGKLRRKLSRFESKSAVEVGVFTTSWDSQPSRAEQSAMQLGHTLVSSILSADLESMLEVKQLKKRQDSLRLIQGQPVSKPTLMLDMEAGALFIPSRRHIGISTSRRHEFSTMATEIPHSPLTSDNPHLVATGPVKNGDEHRDLMWNLDFSGMVVLGHIVKANGEIDKSALVAIDPQDLERHMLILGTTRSGKTTTGLTLVAQLMRYNVNPVVIVPYKVRDWRILKQAYPNVRIFTAGDPNTAPLRINIWVPPIGVHLDKWVQRLAEIFHAWFPNQEVVTMHMKRVILRTYELCNWDVSKNLQGRPILLEDFLAGIDYAIAKGDVTYSSDVKQNFIGALKARLESMLTNNAVVDMFNTTGGITFSELLSTPHIVEMERLHEDVKQLLIGVITAGISEYRMANPSSVLQNVLVLEEAHVFLKRAIRRTDGERTAAQEANSSLALMLRTSGGNGLGIVIMDHLPSQLAAEALKIPNNTIAHKQSHGSEAELAGDLVRLTKEQSDHLAGMDPGEVILLLENHKMPRNVKIVQLKDLVVIPLNKDDWTDERLRQEMQAFFEDNQERLKSEPLTDKLRSRLGLAPPIQRNRNKIRRMVSTPEIEVVYKDIVKRAEVGDTKLAVGAARALAEKLGVSAEERSKIALEFFETARARYEIPEDEAVFQQMINDVGEATA